MTLARRAVTAGFWVLGGYGAGQIIRLATNLVMTRLLLPEAFGLMAVVGGIHFGLAMLSDLGIRASIVQNKKGEDPEFLSTAWSVQIIRGFAIWGLALALAAALWESAKSGYLPDDTVYSEPLLPALIAIVCLSSIVSGFISINVHLASRNLSQGLLAVLELVGQAAAIPVMVLWAINDATVWALVAGGLTASVVKTIASHLIIPGSRCRMGWDRSAFQEIYHFGKWLLAASFFGFIARQGDKLILGAFLSTRELGVYSIAALLLSAAQTAIDRLRSAVGFPALSEVMRDRPQDVSRSYYRMRGVLDVVIFGGAGLLMVLGDDIVAILYDARYGDAGWMLQLLSISLIFSAYIGKRGVFLAAGDSKIAAEISLLQSLWVLVSVPVAAYYGGIVLAVVAVALSPLMPVAVLIYRFRGRGWLQPMNEITLLPLLAVGVLGGLSVEFFLLS